MINVDSQMARKVAALRFGPNSELYEFFMGELRQWMSEESQVAMRSDLSNEVRAHQCGRASSLSDFIEHVEDLRSMALAESN